MTLLGVRAGVARLRQSPQGEWRSAIEKQRLDHVAAVGRLGILCDEQADRVNHGGIDKAVLAYSVDHYPAWRDELGKTDFGPGAMGENLEITGQSEADVCIGDRFQMGPVTFELSQPRQPCWKPAWLNNIADLTQRIAHTGRTGWYLRVVGEGALMPPTPIELIARPHPEWTVARANRLVYQKAEGQDARSHLADLPELAQSWRSWLRGEA